MKYKANNFFIKFIFLCYAVFLSYFLSSCSSTFGSIGGKDEIDTNLPVVKTFRALPDVTSIGFEWKTPDNPHLIDGYIIYRKNKSGNFIRVAFIKNAFSTHYYDGKLQPQTEYEYAIASVGKDSKVSAKSSILNVKTSFIDPVSFAYASQNLASQIKIFWSPSPNPVVKNYIIEKKIKDKFVAIGTTSNRMLVEFFDNNLESDATHTYRIVSQSYDGAKSVPSQEVIGKTRAAPKTIEGVITTKDKPKEIWLEWKASDDKEVIGYNIWYADSENGTYNKLAFIQGVSYIDKIDTNGAIRYYRVTAVDRYKLESKPQEQGVKGKTLPPPQTPKIVRSLIENNIFTLSWEKVSDKRVENYIIYREGAGYGEANRFKDITDTKFIDSNMKAGVTYTYYVVSVDKFGIESLPSKKITLMLDLPDTPQDINNLDSVKAHNEKKGDSKNEPKKSK
ncbi:hypothetical protein CQA53_03960 [Helicobacter didelphidarum]|uniref:Fibronectin type-III domain-containing protein n=1 Tax=Helicobacter didelphidarum TaxID=2040648 RepID=A0A3D8IP56_9HELI|nr:fibronectin type III domain-containing protein [Helicobacter didelphidarum]RDU66381.1 hypothetical protein CQA53_03960 [Helicobacter didelphidarum]